jgi:dihydrofolate reductase
MRKLIVQELISVDGLAAGPNGELDFFDAVSDYSGPDTDNLAILDAVDTILLGSVSYRMLSEYWPTADGEMVAERVNSIPKVVFSSTLAEAPWGRFGPATVVAGSPTDEVRRLVSQPGGDLILWGSLTLARSLLSAGLVDTLHLLVIPVVIGRGRQLLTEDTGALTLLEAKPYPSGIVSLRYAVAKAPD